MITAQNVSKYYESGTSREVRALSDISFRITDGEFVAIVGKSGSGKSTLLNILGGLETPSCGEIKSDQMIISSTTHRRAGGNSLAHYRNRRVGFVFQTFNLIPSLTVLGNILLAWDISGRPRAEGERRAGELLDLLGLQKRQSSRAADLSGGEQQRVAIARALINAPSLLLADEPTGNLDSETADEIIALFEKINRERQTTIIIVTHDLDYAKRARRAITLKDGKIISDSLAL